MSTPDWVKRKREEQRPELLRTYNMRRNDQLTLKVIEMGRLHALLECVTPGPEQGKRIEVDYKRLRLWRAEPIDIQQIKVGVEIVIEGRKNHTGLVAPEVIEWRNV